jgi:hypothetical protein
MKVEFIFISFSNAEEYFLQIEEILFHDGFFLAKY